MKRLMKFTEMTSMRQKVQAVKRKQITVKRAAFIC